LPTPIGGHQSEWIIISNQCYTYAAAVALDSRTEAMVEGLTCPAKPLTADQENPARRPGFRDFHDYRLRLLHCESLGKITRQYRYEADYHAWLLRAPNQSTLKTEKSTNHHQKS
jgi:hypothetical protein